VWKDKVVIITGSSIGIGRKLAIELAKKEAKIVINARNKERLDKALNEMLSEGYNVTAMAGDISKYEDCEKIVEHTIKTFGKLDILVNNAGIASPATLEEISVDVIKKVMDVNFIGSINMTKVAFPYLKQTKGSMLLIGSVAGIHGIGAYTTYSTSKMALTALSETLRIEFHGTGVHTGIAYLGFTENDPEKTFLDKNGESVHLPSRSNMKQAPVDKVVKNIIKMLEKRRFKRVFTLLGKLNYIMNRISPNLIHRVLLKAYKKGIS